MFRALLLLLCVAPVGVAMAQKAPVVTDRIEDVVAALPLSQQPSARMLQVRGSSTGRRLIRGALAAAGSMAQVKGKPATAWKEKDLLSKLQTKMSKASWKSFSGYFETLSKSDRALLVKMLGIRIDLPRRT